MDDGSGVLLDAPDANATSAPAGSSPPEGLFGLGAGVGLVEIGAAALALLIPVVVFPDAEQPQWAPKYALLMAALGPGLILLVVLARCRDRAAQMGLVLLAAWTVSALVSKRPVDSFLGGYGLDRNVVPLAGYLGCWAIGRWVRPDGRRVLLVAAAAGIGINVAVAFLQAATGDGLGALAAPGRAAGLTPSSVFLAGLVAGGGALAGWALARSATWRAAVLPTVGLVGVAAAANLSGSRVGLVGAAGAAALAVVVNRRPLVERSLRLVLVVVAVAAGVLAAGAFPESVTSSGRIGEGTSAGISPRVTMWAAGVEATVERPVLGWGPGRFRAATSSRTTAEFVKAEGPERLFFDAHNVVVEHLTTTGVIGLGLLVAWIVVASRRARGPLAWLAGAIAFTWLLEPVSVSTAPLALLALGAAVGPPHGPRPGAAARGAAVATVCLGSLLGLSVVLGSVELQRAVEAPNSTQAGKALDRADRWLRADSTLADLRYQNAEARVAEQATSANEAAMVAAARRAVASDPERPVFHARLGWALAAYGSREQSRASFVRSLELNPWSELALVGLDLVGTPAQQRMAQERLCELESELCGS